MAQRFRSFELVTLAAALAAVGPLLASSSARAQDAPGANGPALEAAAGPAPAPAPEDPKDLQPWRPRTTFEMLMMGQYGDFHVAVVGEEIITRTDLLGWMNNNPRFEDPTEGVEGLSPEEKQGRQINAALTQLIEQRLKIQGGRAQGYEPELIEAEKQQRLQIAIDSRGGPQNFGALLDSMGVTPEEYKELMGEGLMANLWETSITGRAPGSQGRVIVDNNVRPGVIYSRYREFATSKNLELNEIVGRAPAKVSVQQITLLVDRGGPSPAEVRKDAETMRQRIEEGVLTFDDARRSLQSTSRGNDEAVDAPAHLLIRSLQAQFTTQVDAVETFIREAPVGSLSPVFAYDQGGVPRAFAIQRITGRKEPTEAKPFTDLEVQRRLRERIAEEASEARVARGLAELVRSTYLAPTSLRETFLQQSRALRK